MPIERYIDAVNRLSRQFASRNGPNATATEAPPSVFISTDDPEALGAFRRAAPKHWRLFHDPLVETMRFRPTTKVPPIYAAHAASRSTRGAAAMEAKERERAPPHVIAAMGSQGRSGLESLVSLLIALESDGFVVSRITFVPPSIASTAHLDLLLWL